MGLPYPFRLALQSLFKEFWINLLSILSIAAGLAIISVSLLALYNIDLATRKLPERFMMVVYLDQNIDQAGIDSVSSDIRKKQGVLSARFISKAEALADLKATLKNSDYILEGLDENPLPDAFEVRLQKDAVQTASARKIAGELLKVPGVAEVDYGEKFLSALHELKNGVKIAGIILGSILVTGIIFVCYSTVKILFYRRTDEIETFKLLGATKRFIRAPFLIEGGVIGAGGGLVSLLAMFLFSSVILRQLGSTMPIFTTVIVPWNQLYLLPLAGLLLGIIGAALALGRLRY